METTAYFCVFFHRILQASYHQQLSIAAQILITFAVLNMALFVDFLYTVKFQVSFGLQVLQNLPRPVRQPNVMFAS